jgi:hypothetical protein
MDFAVKIAIGPGFVAMLAASATKPERSIRCG